MEGSLLEGALLEGSLLEGTLLEGIVQQDTLIEGWSILVRKFSYFLELFWMAKRFFPNGGTM